MSEHTEFVAIDERGVERDWIDPVQTLRETDDCYLVDNGYHEYRVAKREGWTYETRFIS